MPSRWRWTKVSWRVCLPHKTSDLFHHVLATCFHLSFFFLEKKKKNSHVELSIGIKVHLVFLSFRSGFFTWSRIVGWMPALHRWIYSQGWRNNSSDTLQTTRALCTGLLPFFPFRAPLNQSSNDFFGSFSMFLLHSPHSKSLDFTETFQIKSHLGNPESLLLQSISSRKLRGS